ncbi:Major Facilitator Superfamily protein [Phycisphaerae bacterium RAS1]|nr:Major Facilitator Superfamily protein [Phycisphaerae bacterium RAS1]
MDFLRIDDIPPLARRNYLLELRHISMWGVFANLVDGSFSSIVVAKTFHASSMLVSFVWATPMLAHILSLVWGVVLRGRPRVPMFVLLAIGALLCAASVALTPTHWGEAGGWIFAAQVAGARIFLSGLVTVRTSMWKSNYPSTHRARIAGRIQMINAQQMLIMSAGLTLLFDRHADYFRLAYPLIGVLGVLSLLPLRRVRVRGERAELHSLRRHLAQRGAAGRSSWRQFRDGLRESAAILRNDAPFARYCTAQYFLGSSNFLVDPVLTVILTKQLGLGYFKSSLLMDLIPTVIMLVTIRAWAGYFDRRGVLAFRVVNSSVWLGAVVIMTLGIFLLNQRDPSAALGADGFAVAGLVVIGVSRMINGVGRGGGSIAWNLGHLHFAGKHDAELYMGVHVALTGLRGVIMPFVGQLTYYFLGWASFLIAIAAGVTAVVLFGRLARGAADPPVAEPGETPSAL